MLRADALGAMLKGGGTLYHPVLVQVMVNALGRHPPGTLLELEDGRYARVVAPARSAELWDRPLVRLLDLRTRQLAPEVVDLATGPSGAAGRPRLTGDAPARTGANAVWLVPGPSPC